MNTNTESNVSNYNFYFLNEIDVYEIHIIFHYVENCINKKNQD